MRALHEVAPGPPQRLAQACLYLPTPPSALLEDRVMVGGDDEYRARPFGELGMAYRGEAHRKGLRQLFGCAGLARGDALHAIAVGQGDGRRAGLESARDVERRPRRVGL